jgi:thymidylate synthase
VPNILGNPGKIVKVEDIRKEFIGMYQNEMFLETSSGKMLEIIGAHFIADENFIIGKPNEEYIKREIEWYKSQSLNVWDIKGNVPKIWQMVSANDGTINSNYGWCIYSKENGEQFKNVLRKLKQDKNSRQAIMIYNRPSMHTEWNENNRSDFMCCQNVQYFIRDDKLHCVVNFRSNDARFGYLNDYAWMKYVQEELFEELKIQYKKLEIGDIIWNAGSLHIYERDFKLIEELI